MFKKILYQNIFYVRKILCPKNLDPKTSWVKKYWVQKQLFGHRDSWYLLKRVPGTYLQNLVKIGSVSAEIFLMWTNVARTNIAWTNVAMTDGINSRWSHESTFEVLLKSGQ